ncbi:MAG: exodeoxyribonuclease VII small subunit [Panacagrimonas sp.]
MEDAVARFEQEMQELESIVAQMEKGDLRLEDSLRLFERGSQLTRSCRRSLDTAELKVRNLLDEDEAAPGA